MFLQVLLICVCVLFIYFLYVYKKIHYKFEAAGLKYLPGVPIFGNVWGSTLLRRHIIDDLAEVYKAFPDEKYVGFAEGMIPTIFVRDPELLKSVVVKDFDHFHNRKDFFPVRLDPLLGRNLLQLKDKEWRTTRAKLTQAFTAAKLRYMLPTMIAVSKNIVNSLKNHPSQDVDLTEVMARYSGDTVSSAAFGLHQETAGRDDSAFYKMGSNIYLNWWRRVLMFISLQFPALGEAIKYSIGLQLFPKKRHDFVRDAVLDACIDRQKRNTPKPDYMDVLINKSEGTPIDDLAGQVFFSYMAAFVSTSSTLRFCFHELALNQKIQEQLYQEIRNHEKVEEMSLASISGLKYLDCVLNETSRRWSAAIVMDRVCTKPYTMPPPREGGKPYLIKPGDAISNVVNPIHMDPKYHDNPEVFNPERFSDENKHKIKQYTFMPFGVGPRGCLGIRFATLQVKVMIYYMLLNFKLLKCEKTADPIYLEPDEMNLRAVGGTWVRLKPRE